MFWGNFLYLKLTTRGVRISKQLNNVALKTNLYNRLVKENCYLLYNVIGSQCLKASIGFCLIPIEDRSSKR